ncbi:hypothetical protein BJY52DRAFT_1417932 [Lactarius psammicola]|nr:hypothetical protein BJY52DRAFT_1417932 [Lactarius psammicola]
MALHLPWAFVCVLFFTVCSWKQGLVGWRIDLRPAAWLIYQQPRHDVPNRHETHEIRAARSYLPFRPFFPLAHGGLLGPLPAHNAEDPTSARQPRIRVDQGRERWVEWKGTRCESEERDAKSRRHYPTPIVHAGCWAVAPTEADAGTELWIWVELVREPPSVSLASGSSSTCGRETKGLAIRRVKNLDEKGGESTVPSLWPFAGHTRLDRPADKPIRRLVLFVGMYSTSALAARTSTKGAATVMLRLSRGDGRGETREMACGRKRPREDNKKITGLHFGGGVGKPAKALEKLNAAVLDA